MALFDRRKKRLKDVASETPSDVNVENVNIGSSPALESIKRKSTYSVPESGKALLGAVFNKKESTANDVFLAGQMADQSNKLETELNLEKYLDKEKIKEEELAKDALARNAESSTLLNLANTEDKTQNRYVATTNNAQIEQDIIDEAGTDPSSYAALEQLSVQDYFPNIGKDIAVGTYSGRRIGSSTIFAAPGMRIPFGVVDARERQLAATVQAKQKQLEAIRNTPDIAPQFKIAFDEYANNEILSIMEKFNYDSDAIMKDRESVQALARLESTAKAFVDADATINGLLEGRFTADGKSKYYLPEEALKFMNEFRSGILENQEDYFSGKKNISEKLVTLNALSDGTRHVDELMQDIENQKVEVPLNLKKGVQLDQAAIQDIETAYQQAVSTNSYDGYVSAIKKYFDIDAKGVLDPWFNANGYSENEPARQMVIDYFNALIPRESIASKIDFQSNRKFDYWKVSQDQKFQKEMKQSLWQNIVAQAQAAGLATDVKAKQELLKTTTDEKKRAQIIADIYNNNATLKKLGFTATIDPNDKQLVYGKLQSVTRDAENPATVGNDRGSIYAYDKNKGRYDWISVQKINAGAVLKSDGSIDWSKSKYIPQELTKGGTSGTYSPSTANKTYESDYNLFYKENKGSISLVGSEYRTQLGYTDANGTLMPLTANNYINFNNASNQTMVVNVRGNPVLPYTEGNVTKNRISSIQVKTTLNAGATADQSVLDVMWTKEQKNTSNYP